MCGSNERDDRPEVQRRADTTPGGPFAARLLGLQGAAGNRAVAGLVADLQRTKADGQPATGTPTAQRHGDGTDLASAATPTAPRSSAAMASSPAARTTALGPSVARRWRAAVAADNAMGALRVVWDAMVQRGEINPALVSPAAADPALANSAIVNGFRLSVGGTGRIVGATNLGCRPGAGAGSAPRPMVAINFPENLFNQSRIGPSQTDQDAAMITLHSALRHEHRHVEQYAAACAGGQSTSADSQCHYCNDPAEMDAYLSEIESGRDLPTTDRANAAAHRAELRRSWVHVFVHWDYLGTDQQAAFAARHTAAQAVIDGYFPGVDWSAEAAVATYRRVQCDPHGSADEQRGQCSAPIARSGSVRPPPPPPMTPERDHLVTLVRFFDAGAAQFARGGPVDDARLTRTLQGWTAALQGAKAMVERTRADLDMLPDLRRSYRAAVASAIRAAAGHLRQTEDAVRRRHRIRLDPWAN